MIETMSTTPPGPRALRRSTADGVIGGVASGIARYLQVDPIVIRIGFVLSLALGGVGLLAYLAAWMLVPDQNGAVELDSARRFTGSSEDLVRIGGLVLVFLAASIFLHNWWAWTGEVLFPLLLIGLGGWLLLRPRPDAAPTGTEMTETASPTTDATPEAAPTGGGGPWGTTPYVPAPPPGAVIAPPPPVTREKRRKEPPTGPPVGRVTGALVVLTIGALGLASAAGADVSLRAVLVACLGITGAGLVVGAFTGRARGLIPLGIALLTWISLTSILDVPFTGGMGERRHDPDVLADIEPVYRLGIGEMVIDLTELDPNELRGERIEIEASIAMGALEVILPDSVTITGHARAQLGDVQAFGDGEEGGDAEIELERAGTEGAGIVDLDLEVGLGEVRVR